MRWKLVLEYDGTDFAGWQVQPGLRTIQGELEAAACTLFQEERVVARASGRTDAGVHALEQVVVIDVAVERSERSVLKGLNALLPADVAVVAAERVADDFDPRSWARSKLYRYRFLDRGTPSPLRRRVVAYSRVALDVDAMDRAARGLVGRHDFASFRAAKCASTHPVRSVTDLAVRRVEDEVHIDVEGNGFLRHMVRIMAGTLEQVGAGRRPPEWVTEVLMARDRGAAGPTAPAHGLWLVQTRYGEGPPAWAGGDHDDAG